MIDDDSDLDFRGALARFLPQGPGVEDDSSLIAVGIVIAVDAAKYRVTVTVRGGTVTLPAIAAPYQAGALAVVLWDATSARPVRVLGLISPIPSTVLGTLTTPLSGGNVTVSVLGSTVTVPALPGAYTAGQTAWIALDNWGRPVLALGPSSTVAPPAPGGGGGGGGSSVVTASVTIGPQSTGTYRSSYGKWDTWGASTGWGLSDIYQGNGYGSGGTLIGLATYGDQIVNLAAIAIPKITLTARRNSSGSGGALMVQGSPHGSRPGGAPSSSGSTATAASVGSGQWTSVDLPADICEAFRTGAVKGLVAVGGAYAGFGGTAAPGSFSLSIQYTRNA